MEQKRQYVIETELPDGYHWFVGIGNHPLAEKKGKIVPMNCWSPYPEEALRMDDAIKAIQVNDNILQDVKGIVVTEDEANFHLGYSKLKDGNFLAPMRIRGLQVGQTFCKRYPGIIYKAVKRLNKNMLCIPVDFTLTDKTTANSLYVPLESTKFIYRILPPVNQSLINN